MARPRSQTVEYFPHQCRHGKTLFIVRQQYGNDGYAFWFTLLELLGSTDGHCYDCNDESAWEFLVAETRLTPAICTEILNLLAKLEAIDRELWTTHRRIWSQNFVDGIKEVYVKRKSPIPIKPSFRTGNAAQPEFPAQKPERDSVSGDRNRQSKVKESKEERECACVGNCQESDTENQDPEPYDQVEHEWQTLAGLFPPRNGIIHDLAECKLKFLGMPKPVRQQVLIGARHYSASREVADGAVMHLMKFLSGRFLNWQSAEPVEPLGGKGRSPTQELLDAINDPSNDTMLRQQLSPGANAVFQAKKLPWVELRQRVLTQQESL